MNDVKLFCCGLILTKMTDQKNKFQIWVIKQMGRRFFFFTVDLYAKLYQLFFLIVSLYYKRNIESKTNCLTGLGISLS